MIYSRSVELVWLIIAVTLYDRVVIKIQLEINFKLELTIELTGFMPNLLCAKVLDYKTKYFDFWHLGNFRRRRSWKNKSFVLMLLHKPYNDSRFKSPFFIF